MKKKMKKKKNEKKNPPGGYLVREIRKCGNKLYVMYSRFPSRVGNKKSMQTQVSLENMLRLP